MEGDIRVKRLHKEQRRLPGLAAGLEYLADVGDLIFKQVDKLVQEGGDGIFTGLDTRAKFRIEDSEGHDLFYAAEETTSVMDWLYGKRRGLAVLIVDTYDNYVMRIDRHYKAFSGYACACMDCHHCIDEVEVQAPPGVTLGYVKQVADCLNAAYSIEDSVRHGLAHITGPRCACCTCGMVEFKILSVDRSTSIGLISRDISSAHTSSKGYPDIFELKIPPELDLRVKAILMGAIFLIDFMYFEFDPDEEV